MVGWVVFSLPVSLSKALINESLRAQRGDNRAPVAHPTMIAARLALFGLRQRHKFAPPLNHLQRPIGGAVQQGRQPRTRLADVGLPFEHEPFAADAHRGRVNRRLLAGQLGQSQERRDFGEGFVGRGGAGADQVGAIDLAQARRQTAQHRCAGSVDVERCGPGQRNDMGPQHLDHLLRRLEGGSERKDGGRTPPGAGDKIICIESPVSVVSDQNEPLPAAAEQVRPRLLAYIAPERKCFARKPFVQAFGDVADAIVVAARTSGGAGDSAGITLFVVPRGTQGITADAYINVDGGAGADLVFDGVRVREEARLGDVDGGFPILDAALQRGLLALSAEAIGVMSVTCDLTVEYLRDRKQFGVHIGSFQALQHRIVEAVIAVEQARSALANAASALDEDEATARGTPRRRSATSPISATPP